MKLAQKAFITAIMLFISAVIFIPACKKDSTNSGNNDNAAITLAASGTSADNLYADVFNLSIQATSDNNAALGTAAPNTGGEIISRAANSSTNSSICVTATITPQDTTWPKTVVLDFGAGCTGLDGVTRKGKITYVFTGRFRTPGTTITATFENYYVNGYKLEGTYSITNNSSVNGLAFTTHVANGKITFPDATYYTYSGTKTVTETAGVSTPLDFSDDVYSITGNHTCASSDGKTLTDTISTDHPLVAETICRHIVSGIVNFTYNGLVSGTLDYGTGTCDDQALITVGANTKTITLP